MDIRVKDRIEEIADDVATHLQSRQVTLDQEILDLEKRAAKLHAERDAIRLAPDRAANIQFSINGHFQCPWCWIERGSHTNLRAIGAADDGRDRFKCPKCENILTV